jgi:hypothetical protein
MVINKNRDRGSRLKELMQVLPALSNDQVKKLIAELKKDGKIYNIGATRAALWDPENMDWILLRQPKRNSTIMAQCNRYNILIFMELY